MKTVRKSNDRGRTQLPWPDSRHSFHAERKPNGAPLPCLVLLASADGAEGSVRITLDARPYLGQLAAGPMLHRSLAVRRGYRLQVMEGALAVGEQALGSGDALGLENAPLLEVAANAPARFLLCDLKQSTLDTH